MNTLMRYMLFALAGGMVIFSDAASAQVPAPARARSMELDACKVHYVDASFALGGIYGGLTAEQQAQLDPVRKQLESAIAFLRSTEGATGYKPLCSDEVIATLSNVVSRAQDMAPPPLTVVEGKAEREALLKAAREFMR